MLADQNPIHPVRHAIILAAGMGLRLRSVVDDRPKGLIEIQGETLVGRSVRLLRNAGITRVILVIGHRAEDYGRFAEGQSDIRLAQNPAFSSTGSMASLAAGLQAVDGPVLVLESDIAYETRALSALLAAPADATVLSGRTGAGDEVWVDARNGTVRAMSKNPADLGTITGEFVGLTRLSAAGAAAMRDAFKDFERARGHGRMDYETGALVSIARKQPVVAILIPDLCWGEVDDDRQYARLVRDVWPVVTGKPRSAMASEASDSETRERL
jgi:choline kinase